jgi:hypothetical protein
MTEAGAFDPPASTTFHATLPTDDIKAAVLLTHLLQPPSFLPSQLMISKQQRC